MFITELDWCTNDYMDHQIAVFGPTGFLGRTFFEDFHHGFQLVAFDRRVVDLTRTFELHLGDIFKRNTFSAAIVCAAISSPDECKVQPELSEQVNVDGTIRLFKVLRDFGIKPIFFSTDHVYDGQKGLYNENDAYSPITKYGEQKVKAEGFLRENFDDFLILRTSKQVSTRFDKKNVLAEMALKLLNDQTIRCATDQSISPIFVEDIVQMTLEALRRDLSGPLHLAPPNIWSRLELGLRIARFLNVPEEMVEPCSIKDFKFAEIRPPKCTLDSSLLQRLLKPSFTKLEDGLRQLTSRLRLSPKKIAAEAVEI